MGEAELRAGDIVADKLRVIRQLGAGGMGAVYEVEHVFTKHRRALKMLHRQFAQSPALVARFLREASAAGRVDNPHIVQTYDAGQLDSGAPYLVMELLAGTPLDGVLGKQKKLEPSQAIEVVAQAAEAMQAAHDAGIVHRDLKPENLFVLRGEQLFVKILDFGISKFDESLSGEGALTAEGSMLGTPFYMSPEQVRGDMDIDGRADVYALGVVLYECLSGKRPFMASNLPELSVRIHEGNCEPLSALEPSLPASIVAIVERAMAREVDERFESAAALAEALRQVASELHLGEAATVMMPSVLPPSLAAGPASELESAATVAATQPARSVEACRADTEAPISVTARRAIRGRPWALAAGGVALVAIVAFAWSALRAGSAPAAEAAVAPGSGSPSAAAAARVAPTDEAAATAVAPSASATDAGPGAPPSAGFRAGPTPKPKPAATKPSRDQRHQMATDNPF